jgi:hypothetical protein
MGKRKVSGDEKLLNGNLRFCFFGNIGAWITLLRHTAASGQLIAMVVVSLCRLMR